jgi:hypothetical protein
MALDESFDERTERQHRETSRAGVFQSEADQPIGESVTLETLVDFGVDERDQVGARTIGGEADHLAVDRELVAFAGGRVGELDALGCVHARKIRARADDLTLAGTSMQAMREVDALLSRESLQARILDYTAGEDATVGLISAARLLGATSSQSAVCGGAA